MHPAQAGQCVFSEFLTEGKPKFSADDKLWLRIFYFNHECSTIDVHNIVKPTLDYLEGFVYPNDRNIIYLESVHLDMQSLYGDAPYFDMEINMDGGVDDILKIMEINMDGGVDDILKIYAETCFLIEAGTIRPNLILSRVSDIVKLKWI